MRRGLLVLSGFLTLALPATAIAHGERFSGPFSSGGTLGMTLLVDRHGEPAEVARFVWQNLPADCAPPGNSTATTGGFPKKIKVNSKGKFKSTQSDVGLTATLKGKFARNLKSVEGTLRVRGAVPGGGTDCDTGTIDWKAKPNS